MDLQSQVILGINCAHDASACLMIDGQIRVAILEERLSRKKHHEGFPHLAINYCLNVANIHDIKIAQVFFCKFFQIIPLVS